MSFFYFMIACTVCVPLVMLIAGLQMLKHPPKKINGFFGYRTKRSRKNADTWEFAHEYCGRLWSRVGLVMLIPSVIILRPFMGETNEFVGKISLATLAIQIIVLILTIVDVERALKQRFE